MWFRRNKIEFHKDWDYNGHKGHVYSSWDEVPYSKYIEWLENPDRRIEIFTGCLTEHLTDKLFKKKMESMIKFSLYPPKSKIQTDILLNGYYYSFNPDLSLLEETTEQWIYVTQRMKHVYDLVEQIEEENSKEEKDIDNIREITLKQSLEIYKTYPYLISAYINIANNQKFNGKRLDNYVELLNNHNCVDILNLGGFFLINSMKYMSFVQNSISYQNYLREITRLTRETQATKIIRIFGVYIYLFRESLKSIFKSHKP